MTELLPLTTAPFEPAIKPSADPGDVGELIWIEVAHLRIDPRYQRPVLERGRRNIRHIAEHFAWAQFSPLVVARRPAGLFAIIDGQHRAIAATLRGDIEKLPCLVITGGPEQEALAFATINGQVTAVTPVQIYFARLAGADPKAVALKDACDRAGVAILRAPKPKPKSGETSAVSTLEACLKRFGAETLITALQAITQTGDGNAGFLTTPVIEGTCEVLHLNKRWRDAGQELFKAVEHISIARIYHVAVKDRNSNKGESIRALFAKAMKAALLKEIGAGAGGAGRAGGPISGHAGNGAAGAKTVDPAILSSNAREVLLALGAYREAVSADDLATLVDVGAGRVPGLLTSLSQMKCASPSAGKWELTAIGRATVDLLKAAGH